MKFCSQCGNQSADQAVFCEKCGTRFAVTQSAPPQSTTAYSSQTVQQTVTQPVQPFTLPNQPVYQQPTGIPQYGTPVAPNYQKMGGWLLFFMILCMVDAAVAIIGVGLLNGLVVVIRNLISGFGSYYSSTYTAIMVVTIITSLIALGAAALEIVFVVQVFKKKHGFLKLYQICKIVSIAAVLIGIIAVCIAYKGFHVGSSDISSLIGGIGGIFLMTLYYCKSVRVRTYMGGDQYMKSALFSFPSAGQPSTTGYSFNQQPYQQPTPQYYQQPTAQPQPQQQVFQQQPIQVQNASVANQIPAPVQRTYEPFQEVPQTDLNATTVLTEQEPKKYKDVFCATCGTQYKQGESKCSKCGTNRE
jgi:hypothetical protein